jgi:hypothetical protein
MELNLLQIFYLDDLINSKRKKGKGAGQTPKTWFSRTTHDSRSSCVMGDGAHVPVLAGTTAAFYPL